MVYCILCGVFYASKGGGGEDDDSSLFLAEFKDCIKAVCNVNPVSLQIYIPFLSLRVGYIFLSIFGLSL